MYRAVDLSSRSQNYSALPNRNFTSFGHLLPEQICDTNTWIVKFCDRVSDLKNQWKCQIHIVSDLHWLNPDPAKMRMRIPDPYPALDKLEWVF